MKFEGENILEFTDRFPDDHSCLAYLSEQKWADGYKMQKNAGITNLPSGRRTLQWTATGATM